MSNGKRAIKTNTSGVVDEITSQHLQIGLMDERWGRKDPPSTGISICEIRKGR